LTADAEAVVETEVESVEEVVVIETVEAVTEEVVAEATETDESAPVIAIVEELPEIVPGLAQPESPALPEDAAENDEATEELITESVTDSAEAVVATPVETIATPE
jgi:hypothetical protein